MRSSVKPLFLLVSLVVLLMVVATFVVGLILGNSYGRRITDERIMYLLGGAAKGGKVGEVVKMIETQYVDAISADSLAELFIPAMLHKLDPHSVYIPAREFKEAEEALQGEFDGIGITFNMATDTVMVLNVIAGGPSQKAGVLAGDRVMRVNDTLISGVKMSQSEVMKRLRGPRGTKVRLALGRMGIEQPVEVVITRDAIPLHSVEASLMLTRDVGFIKLSQFSRTSFSEVTAAIDTLRRQGMRSLIFDLRGNAGGFLDQAILIANEFLPKGSLIVYTEDRDHNRTRQYSNGRGRLTDLEVVVLIDEYSASSSEILAGALQDNDRGTIVGRRSFGKGLVQSQIPFNDGSALRLTVARYFTPTGRSIQKPYTAGGDDYEMDIVNRYNHNEFFSADSIRFADSLRFTTPKGKVVYGGGGIMPDHFIPLDTLDVTRYFAEVSGRNILYRYTIDYTDRHRERLNAVRTMADLERMFASDSGLFERFIDYAESRGVKRAPRQIARSRHLIESQLRAYIARNSKLDNAAFYYFIRPIDKTLQSAVELLDTLPAASQKP
ncbi:MAG: S41 family peptidase [Alistipes sp.]|nr:S41 family peptidase [Alistipes sp.]